VSSKSKSLGPVDEMVYPVLPVRDVVIFPHMVVPLFVGREKSIQAVNAVLEEEKPILLIAQKSSEPEDPTVSDMYTLGTLVHVLQVLTLPNGTLKSLVEGKQRIKVVRYIENEEYFQAVGSVSEDKTVESEDFEALKRTLLKKRLRPL